MKAFIAFLAFALLWGFAAKYGEPGDIRAIETSALGVQPKP